VAKHADWWNYCDTPEVFGQKLEILRQHCLEIGRPFDEIVKTWDGIQITVAESDAEAQRIFEASPYRRRGRVVGTPDRVAARLKQYIESSGWTSLLRFDDFPEQRGIRLFTEEVLPQVADRPCQCPPGSPRMNRLTTLEIPSGAVGIQWFGQSWFAFKDAQGTVLQVDPYGPRTRPAGEIYPPRIAAGRGYAAHRLCPAHPRTRGPHLSGVQFSESTTLSRRPSFWDQRNVPICCAGRGSQPACSKQSLPETRAG
jgi:hypothetical protein